MVQVIKDLKRLNMGTTIWTVVTSVSALAYYIKHPNDPGTFFQILMVVVVWDAIVLGINIVKRIKNGSRRNL